MQNIIFSSPELAGIDAPKHNTNILSLISIAPSEGFFLSVAAVTIAISIVAAKFAAFQNIIERI